jgi:hypothetical protein
MKFASREGETQGLARTEQVLLPDDFVERRRAQSLGERHFRCAGEKISRQ